MRTPGSAARCARDCYDYEAAVLFNFHAGTLFKRFTTYLPRHLARLAGVTRKRLRADLRIRYVKVAEYQARGIIHFHAVIRLDAPGNGYPPPPPRYTAAILCDAITLAARAVRLDAPTGPGRPRVRLGFGPQTKADPIWRQPVVASGQPLDVDAVANYIAKYATKSADVPGLPDTRIRNAAAIGALRCSAHHKRMIATAWRARLRAGNGRCAAAAVGAHARLRRPLPHQIPPLLRHLRPAPPRPRRTPPPRALRRDGVRDPWGRPLDDTVVLVVNDWTYAGTRLRRPYPGAQLALASADRHADASQHDHSTADMIPASPTEGGHRHDGNQRPAHRRWPPAAADRSGSCRRAGHLA